MTSILEIIFAINLPKYVKYFEFGSLKTKTNSQFIGYLLIKIHYNDTITSRGHRLTIFRQFTNRTAFQG